MFSICSLGRAGPLASLPGYDYVGAAYSGVLEGFLGFTTMNLSIKRLEGLLGSHVSQDWLSWAQIRFAFVDGFLSPTIAALANELYSPSERGPLYADTLATPSRFISSISAPGRPKSCYRDAASPDPRCSGLCDRIEADTGGELSIAEVAREAHLSPYHFSRAFKAATGLPPHSYPTARRIQHAKELLATSEMPISELVPRDRT